MKDYGDYEDGRDVASMSWYERKQYERQCEAVGEPNLMPLLTGTEVANLYSGYGGLF